MAKHPFCANDKCIYHNYEVENDQVVAEIEDPTGGSFEIQRVLMDFPRSKRQFFYCECCWNAVSQIMGKGSEPNAKLAYHQSGESQKRIITPH